MTPLPVPVCLPGGRSRVYDNSFTFRIKIRFKPPSFSEFQDLDPHVREALLFSIENTTEDETEWNMAVVLFMIDQYSKDPHRTYSIGKLVDLMDCEIRCPVMISMGRCYLDMQRDMLAAKLAWYEGY